MIRKYYYLSFLLMLCCCQIKKTNELDVVDAWIGKKIELPHMLKKTGLSSELIVVSQINGNCHSCILELKVWEQFIESVEAEDVKFVFYVIGQDSLMIKNYIKEELGFKYPYIVDFNNEFEKLNQLEPFDIFHTMLLNKSNEVIVIGNPLRNNELMDLYKEQIFHFLKI